MSGDSKSPAAAPAPPAAPPASKWSRMFRWEFGRQRTGYEKCLLWEQKWPFPLDCYLLRYPPGTGVSTHTDPVAPGFEHHRINIIVQNPKTKSPNPNDSTATATATAETGDFICPLAIINTKRIKYFRPDIHPHSVTPTPKDATGYRLVFSLGWLRTAKSSAPPPPPPPPQPQPKSE